MTIDAENFSLFSMLESLLSGSTLDKIELPTKLKKSTELSPLGIGKYYPGYAPEFVQSSLELLDAKGRDVVLDPWSGYGTTGWTSQSCGMRPTLVDLNPTMAITSCASDFSLLPRRDEIFALAEVIVKAEAPPSSRTIFPKWMPPCLSRKSIGCLGELYQQGLFKSGGRAEPTLSIIAVAVFSLFKRHVIISKSSNPTHVKLGDSFLKDIRSKNYFGLLAGELDSIFEMMERSYEGQELVGQKVFWGNSKKLPVKSGSVDIVLSSPPYCTRIDYAKMTAIDLTLLECAGRVSFESVRRGLMGAPTIHSSEVNLSYEWGESCIQLLRRVKAHQSYGSSHYYFKNLCQYFNDAFISTGEITRTLRPGGRGIIAVQNSFYKELAIDLGLIYKEMFERHGVRSRVVAKNEVSVVMSQLHKHAWKYEAKKKRRYSEDLVLFHKI